MYIFLKLDKTCDIKTYSITNYKELNYYIKNNSSNNFKILNKKQEVRENFVKDLNYLFQKDKDEYYLFKEEIKCFFS